MKMGLIIGALVILLGYTTYLQNHKNKKPTKLRETEFDRFYKNMAWFGYSEKIIMEEYGQLSDYKAIIERNEEMERVINSHSKEYV